MALDMQKLEVRKQLAHEIIENLHVEEEKAEVILALDISGSMNHMYQDGTVQELLERLLPIAMNFDDNGEIELYLFHDGAYQHNTNIKLSNLDNFVKREIMGKYSFGGTNYAPVLKMIRGNSASSAPKKGFSFGRIFSSASSNTTTTTSTLPKNPKYVMFITDGENSDRSEAERVIKEMSGEATFIQFVGIGSARFDFLEKLDTMDGRVIDNANFFQANDIHMLSDEDLYNKLLGEFPEWLDKARAAGILARR